MHKLKKGASVGLGLPLQGITLPVPVEVFLSWNNWFSCGMAFVRFFRVKNYSYSDFKCTGCGTCEMVCLS